MVIQCSVVAENANSYQGKKGYVSQQRLTLLDEDKEARFLNTFDYDMSDEEKNKFTGKVAGKIVRLGIQDFMPINGRLKARGRIVEVLSSNGAPK
jgi:hypothetical protein